MILHLLPLRIHTQCIIQGFPSDAHGLTMKQILAVGCVLLYAFILVLTTFSTCCSQQFTLYVIDIFMLHFPPAHTPTNST